MTDIFREIDEEVRRDKASKIWEKYQNWIIGLALLIALGAGGWRYWQYQNRLAAETAGARFEQAVQLERE
ncbi:MAG: tetratricopeptide repeat protein, partial [Alphaproteobacteria bacterium]|nr:tetratricopeptide repeat protein [Alphaproteobacteria bacterium]